VPDFDIGHLVKHLLEDLDRRFAVEVHILGQAFDQYQKRVADLADLFAIGTVVRKDILLDFRRGRLTEGDVDEGELAADRAHEGGEGADVLYDIARKREFEDWHASLRKD
jgi:hypothetical protein